MTSEAGCEGVGDYVLPFAAFALELASIAADIGCHASSRHANVSCLFSMHDD
jgi:hypothetical protein